MKLRTMCKSKIHHAVVTSADLHYVGSIGIDQTLMRLTGIIAGEQVSVWNVNNGQNRFVRRLDLLHSPEDVAETIS